MRYDVMPLLDAHGGTHGQVAGLVDVDRTAVAHAVHRGLSVEQAELWAIRVLGVHPRLVWPEYDDEPPTCEGCGEPARSLSARYCTMQCRWRTSARRKRERHRAATAA